MSIEAAIFWVITGLILVLISGLPYAIYEELTNQPALQTHR